MAQYQVGAVSVDQGTNVVTGVGTSWLSKVNVGDTFKVYGVAAIYGVISVDSNTQIKISPNYAGISVAGSAYQITTDWTPNLGLAEIHAGDSEFAFHLTQEVIRKIDARIGQSGILVGEAATQAQEDALFAQGYTFVIRTDLLGTTTEVPSTTVAPTTTIAPTTTVTPTTTVAATTTAGPTTTVSAITTVAATTTLVPTTTSAPTTTVSPTTTTVAATTTAAPTTTVAATTTTTAPTTTAVPTTTTTTAAPAGFNITFNAADDSIPGTNYETSLLNAPTFIDVAAEAYAKVVGNQLQIQSRPSAGNPNVLLNTKNPIPFAVGDSLSVKLSSISEITSTNLLKGFLGLIIVNPVNSNLIGLYYNMERWEDGEDSGIETYLSSNLAPYAIESINAAGFTYPVNDVLKIKYASATTIEYYRNGVLKGTSTIASNYLSSTSTFRLQVVPPIAATPGVTFTLDDWKKE